MAYVSREILDRVAVGDDKFFLQELEDGRVRIIPEPDEIIEAGTDINRELLQLMEDRIVLLLNRLYNDVTANPFDISFESLDGLTVAGVWNTSVDRIEC